jgi:hypothetical protein
MVRQFTNQGSEEIMPRQAPSQHLLTSFTVRKTKPGQSVGTSTRLSRSHPIDFLQSGTRVGICETQRFTLQPDSDHPFMRDFQTVGSQD